MDPDVVEYSVLILLPDQNRESQIWLKEKFEELSSLELEQISYAQYEFAVTERQIVSSNVELVFYVPSEASFGQMTNNIYDFVKEAINSFDAPFSVLGPPSSFSRREGNIFLAQQPPAQPSTPTGQGTARTAPPAVTRPARRQEEPEAGDIWKNLVNDPSAPYAQFAVEGVLYAYITEVYNENSVGFKIITNKRLYMVNNSELRWDFGTFFAGGWQYAGQGPRVGYEAVRVNGQRREGEEQIQIVAEVRVSEEVRSRLFVRFRNQTQIHFASNFQYYVRTPHAGEIWKNTTTEQAFAYILSTYTEDSLTVRYRFITDIAQLIVGEWVLTSESFRADGWQYDSQGPRVGYEAYIDEAFDGHIISRVEVRGNQPIKVYFHGRSTINDAHLYDYRPPRIDQRGRRAHRNLLEDIENESKAQLGEEYTLEEFREKDYPDEKLVFKRFRYDYKTDKWVSTKMVFKDDGVTQELSEVDCDITPLDGDEWGLLMPVKTKVQKPTGEKVWDKNINGELYLYCATDLRDWLNSNKFANYGLYIENEDETYTQNQKNDQTPRTQLKIVAVQYLNKDERDKLQEEYKKKAQDRKLKADERKRERGNEDEAIEKRRRTAEEAMRKALSQNNEQIISTLKRQLNAAEKEIWETEAQDTSSFNSNERETYNTILAGANKRITEFKAKLESQGETAWVKEWEKETNKQAREKEWRISFIKGKVIEEEKKIITRAFNDSLLASLLKELRDLGEKAWVEELDKSRSTRIQEYIEELRLNTTTTTDEERTYSEEEREYDQGYNSESKESDDSDYDSDYDSDPEGLFQNSSSSSLIRRTSRMLKF